MREFLGFKTVVFQIGDNLGMPIYHEHKVAIYKNNIQKDGLDIKIGRVNSKPSQGTKKHTNIRSFRKNPNQFRQD